MTDRASEQLLFHDYIRMAQVAEPSSWRIVLRDTTQLVRRLISLVVVTQAPSEILEEVRRILQQAIELLEPHANRSPRRSLPAVADLEGVLRFLDSSSIMGKAHPTATGLVPTMEDDMVVLQGSSESYHEGMAGYFHGGFLASVFDEGVSLAAGRPGVTASLAIRYLRPTPSNGVRIECHAEERKDRKTTLRGVARSPDGEVTCEVDAVCIAVRPNQLAAILAEEKDPLSSPSD
jgi:acyl-coenzyme A thioesterase PaaI-like protein